MKKNMQPVFGKTKHFFFVLILLTVILLQTSSVFAQTEDENNPLPENISLSGTATSPLTHIDKKGTTHVFWQDSIDGFVYRKNDGQGWGDTLRVRLPFSTPFFATPDEREFEGYYSPMLTSDNDFLYAVWRDEEQTLYFSRANLLEIINPAGWTAPVVVDVRVSGYAVALGENGRLHISYIHQNNTLEKPAGVYYRQYNVADSLWTEAVRLQESSYLRAIEPEAAHIRLSASANGEIYVAWDNPLTESIYLTRSADSGVSWDAPFVVDSKQPEDRLQAVGGRNIEMVTLGNEVHLTWYAEHGVIGCQQYHQISLDNGQTWQRPAQIFTNDFTCPATANFVPTPDGEQLFLYSLLNNENALRIWNGTEWSEPETQPNFNGFLNEQTFQAVSFGCLHNNVNNQNELITVGCSTNAPQDIWVLKRPLGTLDDWQSYFPDQSLWSQPLQIAQSGQDFNSPQIIVDDNNRIHLIWIGTNDTFSLREEGERAYFSVIYYMLWENGEWSSRVPVREVPGADQLSAELVDNQLIIVWRDAMANTLFSNIVDIDKTLFPLDWSDPREIATFPFGVSAPQVRLGQNEQVLHLIYAIPINEGRGIYYHTSDNAGFTWSEPTQIFDAMLADWTMIDFPQIIQTEDGVIHTTWYRFDLTNEIVPQELYYSRKEPNATRWDVPTIIAQGNIIWNEMIPADDGSLIRIWQDMRPEQTNVWFEKSIDSGNTWESRSPILGNSMVSGYLNLAADGNGGVHLFEMQANNNIGISNIENIKLTKWIWRGESWAIDSELEIPQLSEDGFSENFTATFDKNGQLILLYSDMTVNETAEEAYNQLFAIQRTYEELIPIVSDSTNISPETATDNELASSQPEVVQPVESERVTNDSNATSENAGELFVEPTRTDFGDEVNEGFKIGPIDTSTQMGGLLVGAIPALAIVGLVLALGIRRISIKRY
jgi:hypothetical protein